MQDIDELLEVTGESLSNKDLKELVEQMHEDDKISISEDADQKDFQWIF